MIGQAQVAEYVWVFAVAAQANCGYLFLLVGDAGVLGLHLILLI